MLGHESFYNDCDTVCHIYFLKPSETTQIEWTGKWSEADHSDSKCTNRRRSWVFIILLPDVLVCGRDCLVRWDITVKEPFFLDKYQNKFTCCLGLTIRSHQSQKSFLDSWVAVKAE